MAKNAIERFNMLADLAIKFVEFQKGAWDHTAWSDFLLDVQKAGFELTDDMRDYLSSVLESMIKLYKTSTDTRDIQCSSLDIFEHSVHFFMKTRGVYDLSEWETFLKDLQKKGIQCNEEARAYLRTVFEAANEIYAVLFSIIKKEESKKTS